MSSITYLDVYMFTSSDYVPIGQMVVVGIVTSGLSPLPIAGSLALGHGALPIPNSPPLYKAKRPSYIHTKFQKTAV